MEHFPAPYRTALNKSVIVRWVEMSSTPHSEAQESTQSGHKAAPDPASGECGTILKPRETLHQCRAADGCLKAVGRLNDQLRFVTVAGKVN